MGIRFHADHLTCPACGAAVTPLNRCEPDHKAVTDMLAARYPRWDADDVACEECVAIACRQMTDTSLLSRLKSRFIGHEETRSVHRYRTTELV